MTFHTELVVRKPRGSKDVWVVHEPLVWEDPEVVPGDGSDGFTVPVGFRTDFASVPRPFLPVVPKTGLYTEAAVLHDYLYVTQPLVWYGDWPVSMSREEADMIFRRVMEELGVAPWRRALVYRAVRVGGWRAWARHRERLRREWVGA